MSTADLPRRLAAARAYHATAAVRDEAPEAEAEAEAEAEGGEVISEENFDPDMPMTVPGKKVYSDKIVALADTIVNLNLLEASDLTDLLKERFGIDEAATFMPMGMGGGGGMAAGGDGGGDEAAEEAPAEEKTHVDVKLAAFDAKSKIKIIKEVRSATGLGLKEAKELVESAPATIKTEVKVEEAEELKKKLEELGATVELD